MPCVADTSPSEPAASLLSRLCFTDVLKITRAVRQSASVGATAGEGMQPLATPTLDIAQSDEEIQTPIAHYTGILYIDNFVLGICTPIVWASLNSSARKDEHTLRWLPSGLET